MQWKDLSTEAKNVLEWTCNPFTDKKEEIDITVGQVFHRDIPKGIFNDKNDKDVDILITKDLFCEIKQFVLEDEELFIKVDTDTRLCFADAEKCFEHDEMEV